VRASINTGTIGYERTFGLRGYSADLGIALPSIVGDPSGKLEDQSRRREARCPDEFALRAHPFGSAAEGLTRHGATLKHVRATDRALLKSTTNASDAWLYAESETSMPLASDAVKSKFS
jgi:hypothetical protein